MMAGGCKRRGNAPALSRDRSSSHSLRLHDLLPLLLLPTAPGIPLRPLWGGAMKSAPKWTSHSVIAGACAGLVSSVVMCPLDVIKTKLQAQRVAHGKTGYLGVVGWLSALVVVSSPFTWTLFAEPRSYSYLSRVSSDRVTSTAFLSL